MCQYRRGVRFCQRPLVIGRDWEGTALGSTGILFNVAQGAAEAFSPLKAVLGVISAIRTNYEVRLLHPT